VVEPDCDESQSEDDPDFNPTSNLDADQKQMMAEGFIQEWITILSRNDLMSLVITLNYLLVDKCSVLQTAAASMIAKLIHRSERTV